jgi:hypothetical protein
MTLGYGDDPNTPPNRDQSSVVAPATSSPDQLSYAQDRLTNSPLHRLRSDRYNTLASDETRDTEGTSVS